MSAKSFKRITLDRELWFPDPLLAPADGLVAIGGDLSPERLLLAYRMGIFPWYDTGEPILWWSPDPRLLLFPAEFHISKSLRRKLNQRRYQIRLDHAFGAVIENCANFRGPHRRGTWILPEMIEAYCRLHELGWAHSIEYWQDGALAGGMYGVSLGACFFGESMFSLRPDASKIVLAHFAQLMEDWRFDFLDCQLTSPHLLTLGAREVPRAEFLARLNNSLKQKPRTGNWGARDAG